MAFAGVGAWLAHQCLVLPFAFPFSRLLERKVERARGHADAGDRARDGGDWGAAGGHYRRALRCDPSLAHIWVQYGHALKEGKRDLAGAEWAYRRALALRPDVPDTYLQLGHCLKLQGRRAAAHAAYLAALGRESRFGNVARELVALGDSRQDVNDRIAGIVMPPVRAPGGAGGLAVWRPTVVMDLTAVAGVLLGIRQATPFEAMILRVVAALAVEQGTAPAIGAVLFDAAERRWRGVAVVSSAGESGLVVGESVTVPREVLLIGLGPVMARSDTYFIAIRAMLAAGGCFCPLLLAPAPDEAAQDEAAGRWLAEAVALADHVLLAQAGFELKLAAWVRTRGLRMPAVGVVSLIGVDEAAFAAPGAAAARPVVMFAAGDAADTLAALRAWEAQENSAKLYIIPGPDGMAGGDARRTPALQAMVARFPRLAGRVVIPSTAAEQHDELLRTALFSIHPTADGSGAVGLMRAMACGHAVIARRDPAFFELARESADYVDFSGGDELSACCARLLRDDGARSRRAAEVLRHARDLPRLDACVRALRTRLLTAPVVPRCQPPIAARRVMSGVFYGFADRVPESPGPESPGPESHENTEPGVPLLVGRGWRRIDGDGAWMAGEEGGIACRLHDWFDDAYCLRLALLAPGPGMVSLVARDGHGDCLARQSTQMAGGPEWCWLAMKVTFTGVGRELRAEIKWESDAAARRDGQEIAVGGIFLHPEEQPEPWLALLEHITSRLDGQRWRFHDIVPKLPA